MSKENEVYTISTDASNVRNVTGEEQLFERMEALEAEVKALKEIVNSLVAGIYNPFGIFSGEDDESN